MTHFIAIKDMDYLLEIIGDYEISENGQWVDTRGKFQEGQKPTRYLINIDHIIYVEDK